MPFPESRFSPPVSPPRAAIDHLVSTVAFTLLIATWVVGYVSLVPADPVQHRTHVAEVRP